MKSRRVFIRNMAGVTAGIMLPGSLEGIGRGSQRDRFGELLPLRKLGSTGEKVTMLGLGGYHIGWTSERDAREVIDTAIEGGIRFFDTAHSYADGVSEERYGKYLVPAYRDQVFIMTKSTAEDAKSFLKEVDLSLKRLKTDRVDLVQIHSLRTPQDVEKRIDKGVVDAILSVKESGKARYIGFTGHQNPYAHLRMLDHLQEGHGFSTVQMPLNVIDLASEHSFVRQTLPVALEKNLGLLAMKTLADGRFFSKKVMNGDVRWETGTPVIPDYINVREALYFSWSLPVSVLITGAENKKLLTEKIAMANDFIRLPQEDRERILENASKAPGRKKVEYYKNVEA